MKTYFDKEYGLLNAGLREFGNQPDENAPLYELQYMEKFKDKPVIQAEAIERLSFYWNESKTAVEGLYNQRPWRDGGKEDLMSPDQLIALVCFLKRIGAKEEIKKIWRYLWTHCFTYNNLTGKTDFQRTMQPKAILTCAVAAGHFYLIPLLALACYISCRKVKLDSDKNTSGALKAWTIMKFLNLKNTFKMCSKFAWDWRYVFGIYYSDVNHPLNPDFKV